MLLQLFLFAVSVWTISPSNAACNCESAGTCLKQKISEAFDTIKYLSMQDIPEQCRNADVPSTLAELEGKLRVCVPNINEPPPKDVAEALEQNLECAHSAVRDGCARPNPLALTVGRLLEERFSEMPIPGCGEGFDQKRLPAFLRREESCDMRAKLRMLKQAVEKEFPELVGVIQCVKRAKCEETKSKLGNVKAECIEKFGCDVSNLIGGVMNVKKQCLQNGPPEKMKQRFTQICRCVGGQLNFPESLAEEICDFPENCSPQLPRAFPFRP